MWADSTTHINGISSRSMYTKRLLISSRTVTFDQDSHGQLAAVIYEWSDVGYLGKVTSYIDDLPVIVSVIHRGEHVLTTPHRMSN